MQENQIEINGIPYDILFVRREVDGSFLMLVEDEKEDTYCLLAKEENGRFAFYPADDKQIESVVKTYNETAAHTFTWQGTLFEIAAELGSITAAHPNHDASHLYPFRMEQGQYVPAVLSEEDLSALAELYKVRIEDNHAFLLEAETLAAPRQNSGIKTLCYLDGVSVQLDISTDQKPGLLFIQEGRYVTSPMKRMQLLHQFLDWENKQYEKEMHFTLTNYPTKKAA